MDFQRLLFSTITSPDTKAASVESATSRAGKSALNGTLELRRARSGDLPSLTNLLTRSFHGSSNQPFWFQAILRFSIQEDLRQRLQNPPKGHACWVAVYHEGQEHKGPGQLVGTVEMGLRSPLTLGWLLNLETWLAPNQNFLYISNLAVAASFRRQGIASQLLQRCECTALKWQQPALYLHVLENNQAARSLYELAGFGFERVDPSLESILFNRDRRQLWRKPLTNLH